jgi:hypothetical protein
MSSRAQSRRDLERLTASEDPGLDPSPSSETEYYGSDSDSESEAEHGSAAVPESNAEEATAAPEHPPLPWAGTSGTEGRSLPQVRVSKFPFPVIWIRVAGCMLIERASNIQMPQAITIDSSSSSQGLSAIFNFFSTIGVDREPDASQMIVRSHRPKISTRNSRDWSLRSSFGLSRGAAKSRITLSTTTVMLSRYDRGFFMSTLPHKLNFCFSRVEGRG